jgi:protein tyrosine phosphatase
VKSVLVDNKCPYLKRKLSFESVESDFKHELDHYQYAEWPDKAMPDEDETIMALVERINEEHSENDWPILVFCK